MLLALLREGREQKGHLDLVDQVAGQAGDPLDRVHCQAQDGLPDHLVDRLVVADGPLLVDGVGSADEGGAVARHAKATRHGEDMRHAQDLLAAAVASVAGKSEERAVASLFSPGGTHAMKGEFAGMNDFEVLAYMVVLPGSAPGTAAPA